MNSSSKESEDSSRRDWTKTVKLITTIISGIAVSIGLYLYISNYLVLSEKARKRTQTLGQDARKVFKKNMESLDKYKSPR